MKLTKALEEFATARVLLFGLTGSGKTTLAATLASKYHLIWIDTENALDTLAKLPPEHQANVDVIRIPDSAAFPMAAQTLQKLFKELKAKICEAHGVINCSNCMVNKADFQEIDLAALDPKRDIVVLDSLTQVGASFLAHLMKAAPIDAKPERDDWGGLRKNTEFLGSNIQRLPCNFVATALCVEAPQEDGSVRLVPSFGSKDMGANIPAKFSTLIYCEVKNKKHKAYSSSIASNLFLSKSRTGIAIEEQEELSLVPMFEHLLERAPSYKAHPSLLAPVTKVEVPTQAAQVATPATAVPDQNTRAKMLLNLAKANPPK